MNSPWDHDLTRPSQNGMYFVTDAELAQLGNAAKHVDLAVTRTDLTGCHGKTSLLERLATSLALPADFGHNWNALADGLRDLDKLTEHGRVLLFEHADALQHDAERDFATLVGMLDDAATFAQDADRPFFAFIALPPEPSA